MKTMRRVGASAILGLMIVLIGLMMIGVMGLVSVLCLVILITLPIWGVFAYIYREEEPQPVDALCKTPMKPDDPPVFRGVNRISAYYEDVM